ncbi:MAG TPA: 1-(5-phosphoribosyl)-5-[(5-phosphoribosylamino)methylideneamino]imidazole-4-carboxamide isomerase [Ktedonobacteraceae bacterium]|jgi:phosphoribosylformimino-5-aminoimidazole carboxamide ribotide isomerase|nr:1-(5-phosphoribosyl)-5-[(5-phosphoribosylamino)methylideneamino]imidazole-4-carboxamide isomerase [Ktedonobacteraceae bacterium]
MIILPAVDMKDGQCVRLYQGDFERVTIYDADPVRVARRWQAAGANWLHLVDLDGAVAGHPVNLETVAQIRAATSLSIELGGGMRGLAHIEQILDLGVERVILGTMVLTDRVLLKDALARWGERIAIGLDARDGLVAISGWREMTQVRATSLAAELYAIGVQRFIYTDIARDGALQGPNVNALRAMQQSVPCSLIASGGISSLEDIRMLAALGIEGAIIGKALYTGDVDLVAAIRAVQEVEKG